MTTVAALSSAVVPPNSCRVRLGPLISTCGASSSPTSATRSTCSAASVTCAMDPRMLSILSRTFSTLCGTSAMYRAAGPER